MDAVTVYTLKEELAELRKEVAEIRQRLMALLVEKAMEEDDPT